MDAELAERAAAGLEAVRGQIETFLADFGNVASEWKPDRTRVTQADRRIGEEITAFLRRRFPDDDVFSEEMESGSLIRKGRHSWVLDPIDGTNNYATGFPHCAISLGLLRDGFPIHGIIYDHARRTLFHGGPGAGLFANGSPLPRPTADQALGFIGLHSASGQPRAEELGGVLNAWKIRALGSAALHLAYTATGFLRGAVDYKTRVWDIAAACALCDTAGIEIRFLDGSPFPLREFSPDMPRVRYCAGPPEVARELESLLRNAG